MAFYLKDQNEVRKTRQGSKLGKASDFKSTSKHTQLHTHTKAVSAGKVECNES